MSNSNIIERAIEKMQGQPDATGAEGPGTDAGALEPAGIDTVSPAAGPPQPERAPAGWPPQPFTAGPGTMVGAGVSPGPQGLVLGTPAAPVRGSEARKAGGGAPKTGQLRPQANLQSVSPAGARPGPSKPSSAPARGPRPGQGGPAPAGGVRGEAGPGGASRPEPSLPPVGASPGPAREPLGGSPMTPVLEALGQSPAAPSPTDASAADASASTASTASTAGAAPPSTDGAVSVGAESNSVPMDRPEPAVGEPAPVGTADASAESEAELRPDDPRAEPPAGAAGEGEFLPVKAEGGGLPARVDDPSVVTLVPELWPSYPTPQQRADRDIDRTRRGTGRHIRTGLLVALIGFGGLGAWATLAPMEGATIARGNVAPSTGRKTVQHLEGGIIREILVKDGATVEAGQVVMRLDDTQIRASLDQLLSRYHGLLAREARLVAEREEAPSIRFSNELLSQSDPQVQELMTAQRQLFAARREAYQGQLQILRDRIRQYETQIQGTEAQRKSAQEQLVFIADELDSARKLYEKGIYEKPKVLALERSAAGLRGSIGSYTADIARAREAIGESQSRILDLGNQRSKEIATELEQVQANRVEYEEKIRAGRDVLDRTDIRATATGAVVGLAFRTVGGILPPRADILGIVPKDDSLIVEIQIQPNDIDVVHAGLPAEVRFPALNYRTTPIILGEVVQVSADRVMDPVTRQPLFEGKVEVTPEALRTAGDIVLQPGMPAEVHVLIGKRTFLEYLLKPMTDAMGRAFREE